MLIDEIENLKDREVILYCRSGKPKRTGSHVPRHDGIQNTKTLPAECWAIGKIGR